MTTAETIKLKIELAATYLEDGAPRTAAMRLREAAALCDRLADARNAAARHASLPGAGA